MQVSKEEPQYTEILTKSHPTAADKIIIQDNPYYSVSSGFVKMQDNPSYAWTLIWEHAQIIIATLLN